MDTTRHGEVEYVGVDLTDGTLVRPRSIDVCGLRREGDNLSATFWTWTFAKGGTENVAALLPEVSNATRKRIDAALLELRTSVISAITEAAVPCRTSAMRIGIT